jgi:3-dehydroquinate dehydratase/shikimate dehydrogenase
MTHLAVSIMVVTRQQALADAALAAEHGADVVEYRLDRFAGDIPGCLALVNDSPLPCIVTIRPTWEGGEFEGSTSDRIALWQALAASPRPPVYFDIELLAWEREATIRSAVRPLLRDTGTGQIGLILSSHDFQTRPADLLRRVAAMAAEPACSVVKIAYVARSLRDNLEALDLPRETAKPTIALCMGEFGLPSRVLAGKFGSMLTFASLSSTLATAPGQVPAAVMKSLYRWDRITEATRVYGVVGYPVGHSMSPAIHNAGFDAIGFDGVYLPMSIPPEYEHFKATMITWLDHPRLAFRGVSVTIPHKANLLRFVDERGGTIDPLARRIGAANTLTVGDDGSLHAGNTDYAAALDAVCDAMHIDHAGLAGVDVAVIGAGGAARAVTAAFAHHGARVTLYNRTLDKADELAQTFGATARPMDDLPDAAARVYINCTPIGMHPNVDASPLDPLPPHLGPGTVIFDTIYNPIETRLLQAARQRGCTTVSGLEMFVRQAAGQFEGWTKHPAPIELFEKVVRDRLASK